MTVFRRKRTSSPLGPILAPKGPLSPTSGLLVQNDVEGCVRRIAAENSSGSVPQIQAVATAPQRSLFPSKHGNKLCAIIRIV